MEKSTYGGPERRRSIRVTYTEEKRAVLKIDEKSFELADISEMGLRFYYDETVKLPDLIKGTVQLLCGEVLEVEGLVVRRMPAYIYMNVNQTIAKAVLHKEQSALESK